MKESVVCFLWAVMESVLSKALGLQKLAVGEPVAQPVTESVFSFRLWWNLSLAMLTMLLFFRACF